MGRDIRLGGRILAYNLGLAHTVFLHKDVLGSTHMATGPSGSLLQDQLFYPFGQSWTSLGTWQEQGFAGFDWLQTDDDRYPTPTRSYQPRLGRWLTPDPGGKKVVRLDDPQTWNAYAYVRNNPTTLTDPTGLYTAGCNGDVKNCSKQIANFDKSLQNALKSKNADIRKAAEAYGALGDKNGVNVTFAKVVDPKHADIAGQTSNQAGGGGVTYDASTNTFQQATQVTIKAGMGGTDLQETAVHEGVHVEDRAAFVGSLTLDLKSGNLSMNTSLNISGRQSEINAYGVENSFRRFMGLPTLDIQDILGHPPYSDNPNIDNPLFPLLPGPQ